MGIGHHIATDRAQSEAGVLVVGGLLEAPVVENQAFRKPLFDEQFPVIAAVERLSRDAPGRGAVEIVTVGHDVVAAGGSGSHVL